MTILQVLVFDKTYFLVLRNSTSVHPERAPSSRVVSCIPTISLTRTKLKYGAMKLKAYEKFIWMVDLGAVDLLRLKGSFIMHPESAL